MTSSTRRPLTREGIVDTAIGYVDEHGLSSLTMRQLGQLLGVEAMSIYHHVNGREDLLEAIVDRLVAEVRVPPHATIGPADGWQGFLQHIAHSVRSLAVEHPRIFPLVATRPPAAPWLRPPMRSLDLVEDFLTGLRVRGLSDDDVVHVYRVFTSFLLGQLLLEVSAEAGVPPTPAAQELTQVTDASGANGSGEESGSATELDLTEFPTLVALEDRLRRHSPLAEFERALEALLDRLDGEIGG